MSVIFYRSESASITLDRDPEHSSSFYKERINQFSQETGGGSVLVYDNSVTILKGTLQFRYVSDVEARAMENFIVNTIRFQRFLISLIPPDYVDLGLGLGVNLVGARYNGGATTQGIIEPVGKANKFNINFPYRFVVVPGAGTVDQEGTVS